MVRQALEQQRPQVQHRKITERVHFVYNRLEVLNVMQALEYLREFEVAYPTVRKEDSVHELMIEELTSSGQPPGMTLTQCILL